MLHQFEPDLHSYYQNLHHAASRKLWLVTMLLALMVFLTGCMKVKLEYIFRDDGSATLFSQSTVDKRQYAAFFLYGIGSEKRELACEMIFRHDPKRNENSHFGFFGDWITDVPFSVVSVDRNLHEIDNECVLVITEEVPPGTLSDSFNDGRLEVYKYPDGKWGIHLQPDESYTDSDSVIDEDTFNILEDLEIHMSITVPGQPIRHNAHYVSTNSGSTSFLWQTCDYQEFEKWAGSTQFADTEPTTEPTSDASRSTNSRLTRLLSENCGWSKLEEGVGNTQFAQPESSIDTSNTVSTALIIAIAAVVFTVAGCIPFWIIRKQRLESDIELNDEA